MACDAVSLTEWFPTFRIIVVPLSSGSDSSSKIYFLSLYLRAEMNMRLYFEDMGARGGVVVKALRYKQAGRGFDSRWCHWNFSVT